MMRVRAVAVVASIVAVVGSAALLRGQSSAPSQAPPAGAKLTAEQIFESQMKQNQPGNADAGRPIFEKQCAICHRFGALGTEIGPDLSTITSRFQKKDVLEAILWPSKVISDQYKSEMFQLKSGQLISGVIVRETAARVLVRTAEAPERPVSIPKAQIEHRGESKVSMMPDSLLDGYSQADVANLLAFLMAPPPTTASRSRPASAGHVGSVPLKPGKSVASRFIRTFR